MTNLTGDTATPTTTDASDETSAVAVVEEPRNELREQTRELGRERNRLKAAIAPLKAIAPADRTPQQRVEFGRLARQLDRVTTEMVDLNTGLARKYVSAFTGRTTRDQARELEQAAMLGLMSAIDSYDPDAGAFSSWAFARVKRETLNIVRQVSFTNLNMTDFEIQGKVRKSLISWERQFGDAPLDHAWVAADAGVTVQQVGRIINQHTLISTETPLSTDDGGATLGDMIADESLNVDDTVISALSREALEKHALPLLTAQELFVVTRYLGMDAEPAQNLNEIGQSLGLSRESVRQAYQRALAKLKHPRVMLACLKAMSGEG
jgi:RNA polymerase nonessential primary-like sigma factor